MFDYRIKKPSQCTKDELQLFEEMVIKGDQVAERGLTNRIRRAEYLAFCYDGSQLVGVVALKSPDASYRQSIFSDAKATEQADNYDLELGWAHTLKQYRGQRICSNLVQRILETPESKVNLFATTTATKPEMQRVLIKHGFEKHGISYRGERGDYQLQLYLRKLPLGHNETS